MDIVNDPNNYEIAEHRLNSMCTESSNLLQAFSNKMERAKKLHCCVLMMGMFHMLMTYTQILLKRFDDAGLQDAHI